MILEEAPLGPEREVPGAEKLKDMLGGARPDLVKDSVPYLKERWEEPGTIAT